ncbi:MATE family efflux transporter [Nonomuraea maritima]|uniref:MATE family efflux transporter n=1 Tax=Nonomuraea maritima TaxID=683260 RepID=UPI003722A46E
MSSPHRVLLTAAIPLLVSASAGVVAQLVGASLLGRQATVQLAAFALVGAVLNPVTAAVSGGLRGMAPFVAACRDRPAEALAVLKDARWLSLGLGVAGAGVMLCVPLIARIGGAPPEVTAEFGALQVLFALHVLLSAAGGGANGMLVALGRSRLVLRSSLPVTGVQVVLLLVLVPSVGVQGTGVALVLSNTLLLRLPEWSGQSVWPGRPRPRRIARMARVGVPMSATLVVKFTVMGSVTYAAARTGAHGAAAHAVLIALDAFVGLSSMAVGQALAPEMARTTSAREARRLRRAALTVVTGAVATGGLALLLLGEEVLGLFSSDRAVVSVAVGLLPLFVLYALGNNAVIVTAAALTGLRSSGSHLAVSATGYGLLAVVAGPVAAAWGMPGLWTALAAACALILAAQTVVFGRRSSS